MRSYQFEIHNVAACHEAQATVMICGHFDFQQHEVTRYDIIDKLACAVIPNRLDPSQALP